MKAIPTRYRGMPMRSRLEANWAATLDQRGIAWEYEPDGYELSDGTRYLPDFWLPTARAWLEVKGSHMERITKVEQFAAELWAESGATCTYDHEAPLVLIGQEPGAPDGNYHQGPKINMVGVMGSGKRYSVAMATCPSCLTGTIIALWQPWCRNCRAINNNGWNEEVTQTWRIGFTRVARPTARP